MNKTLKELLKYIETETPVTIGYETITPTKKLKGYDKPVNFNVVTINQGTNALMIYQCGCRNDDNKLCGKIGGIEVLYHNDAAKVSAEIAGKQIKNVLPEIPVSIRNNKTGKLTKIKN